MDYKDEFSKLGYATDDIDNMLLAVLSDLKAYREMKKGTQNEKKD